MSVIPPQASAPVGRVPFGLTITVVAASAALLAACATPPPPPPPPPPAPPPVVETVPYRPLPPGGAHYVMNIPPRGPDGRRVTVNSGISNDHLVWHLRSAWNVAALNCLAPEYEPILEGYRGFLTRNARTLKAVNDRIEAEYLKKHKNKRAAMVARDGQVTQVYNFFALPAARAGFCRAALDMANRALAAPPTNPLAFAQENFDGLLVPFETFFDEYEAYQRASAEWDAKWGAQYGPSQPGWVAVQEARAKGLPVPSVVDLASQGVNVQNVIDPVTGQPVPVVPVNEGVTSQPVVQPLAEPPPRKSGQ
ncbi:hypothetical protein [Erythrobacter tepidarius]|uniref:hypothetical protein n=1 Tax=Erythrobacter tepidarius TaxID=60454 RepID=UPI000A3B9855|nr:hypothetical protein [Erythrobacter tepidarius]